MTELCLGLALTLIQARIPATEFTLAWTHSVEKVLWEEDYRLTGDRIVAVAARVAGSGAGMEPPPGAIYQQGRWHYRPDLPPLDRLRLTRSPHTTGYRLCWNGACRPLDELLGPPPADGGMVELFPCHTQ